jgi:hypothetical protein
MIKLKNLIREIKASEAYDDRSALQTVIDGRRPLGFISLQFPTKITRDEFWDVARQHAIQVVPVEKNPYDAYIYYSAGNRDAAIELRDIANRYDGYLSAEATKQDTIRIGQLLGYDQADIDDFVATHYPADEFDWTGIKDAP